MARGTNKNQEKEKVAVGEGVVWVRAKTNSASPLPSTKKNNHVIPPEGKKNIHKRRNQSHKTRMTGNELSERGGVRPTP